MLHHVRSGLATLLAALLTVQRFLFGLMFLISGVTWARRDDPVAYLLDAIRDALMSVHDDGIYGTFLEAVVVPNPVLFVILVGAGEFLTGAALLTGFPPRAGGLGGVFLAVNYGLAFQLGSGLLPPGGNYLLALVMVPLATSLPYRWLTVRPAWVRRVLGLPRAGSPAGGTDLPPAPRP